MADATAIPEPIPNRTDAETILRNWANVRLAHEGLMIDKIQKQTAAVLDLAKRARNGTLGKQVEEPTPDEEMGVNIGNETHNHIQLTAAPEEASVTQVASKAAGVVPTLLMGASLLGGGAGLGYILNDMASDKQPAVVQPAPTAPTAPTIDTDTDNISDVTFPE